MSSAGVGMGAFICRHLDSYVGVCVGCVWRGAHWRKYRNDRIPTTGVQNPVDAMIQARIWARMLDNQHVAAASAAPAATPTVQSLRSTQRTTRAAVSSEQSIDGMGTPRDAATGDAGRI